MSVRTASLLLGLVLFAAPALADYGSPPPAPQPTTSTPASTSPTAEAVSSARADAERWYKDGYDDVVKGGKELEKGKKENADKRYTRALERCQKAVALDSTYHEAWNLIGFTSRKLGDYTTSFAAYQVALRLKPDFALAHEYYGEGLLEKGDLAGAKQQLDELRKVGTPELIAELEGAVTKYEAAHPSAAAPASASTGASAPDTSTTATPGK